MSDDLGNKNSSDDLKKKILSSMNTTFTGEATQRWITAMKDEAFDDVEEAVPGATDSAKLSHSMAAVIDRLFDNFKRYSFEYNRTQEDREFEINCERPASMRTGADYMDQGKPIKFCLGHLASRHWCMVIQGEENRIFTYILPVEYLVGFKPSPAQFPPHLEMRLTKDPTNKSARDVVWSIGGQLLAQDSLPVLARRLFTQLVKVCKGEAQYAEKFSLSPQEERLALAQAATAPVDRAYEGEDTELMGQKKAALAERTFVVASEQVEQLTAALASGNFPAGTAPPHPHTGQVFQVVQASIEPPAERPPYNAFGTPGQLPPNIPASSSYPQVAAAIANGEPKALTQGTPHIPDTAPSFPRHQTIAEQAETFPKLPVQDMAPAIAPTRTFMHDPGNHFDDEAIAAVVFQAPPVENQIVAPEPEATQARAAQAETAPEANQAPAQELPPSEEEAFTSVQAAPAPVQYAAPEAEPEPVPEAALEPEPEPEPAPPAPPEPPAIEAIVEAPMAEQAPPPPPPPQPPPPPPPPPAQQAQQPVSPWIGPNGEPARVATPSQAAIEIPQQAKMQQHEANTNNGKSSIERQTADAKTNIAQSLKTLFETVDGAINGLTAIGMTAMQEDDLETVSAVMKQTKSLKGFRDSVVALSKDWQSAGE